MVLLVKCVLNQFSGANFTEDKGMLWFNVYKQCYTCA